jgi:NAD(P)-dependent dehydrogenase (short-subunit alcohol dehydrogenase family)
MASPITDYDDTVAVVTGGASGVGQALGRMLLDRGTHLVLADVEQSALDRATEALEQRASTKVLGVRTDVTDADSVQALADEVFATFGRVNVLFNNAGVGAPSAKVWETTPNDWQWVHAVNLFGVVYGIQAFVPRMLESGAPGYVVNTTSGDGAIAPMPTASAYAASKAGVAITTECLAFQLEEMGANVAAGLLFPSGRGLISTGMWTADRNRHAKWERERPRPEVSPEIQAMKDRAQQAAAENREVFDAALDELANAVLDGILAGSYVLTLGDFTPSVDRLRERADRYERRHNPVGGPGDGH